MKTLLVVLGPTCLETLTKMFLFALEGKSFCMFTTQFAPSLINDCFIVVAVELGNVAKSFFETARGESGPEMWVGELNEMTCRV